MGENAKEKDYQLTDNTNPNVDNKGKVNTTDVDEDLIDEDEDLEEDEGKKEKTFTQTQVNRMISKEKKNLKNSILKELGLENIDKDKLDGIVSYLKSSKTDEEKGNEKVKELEKKLAEQSSKNLKLQLKNMILSSNVDKEYEEAITALALSKMEDDSDLEDIIDEIKEKHPNWFGENVKATNKGTGKSFSGSQKKNAQGNQTIAERLAAKKSEQMKIITEKKSFWD